MTKSRKNLSELEVYFCELQGFLSSFSMLSRVLLTPQYKLVVSYLDWLKSLENCYFDPAIEFFEPLTDPDVLSNRIRCYRRLSFWSPEDADFLDFASRCFCAITNWLYNKNRASLNSRVDPSSSKTLNSYLKKFYGRD